MKIIPLACIVLALAAPAAAQPSISASVGPDLSSITGSDGATRQVTAGVSFEHLARAERLRLFYDFDTGDYATPGSWRFLQHTAGSSFRFSFGPKDAHRLYVGGDGTIRRNGDSWGASNYLALGTFANLELHQGPATVRSGYRLDVRRFADAPAMDQRQHSLFGSVLVNFQTRTTLIAEVTGGTKRYDAVSARTEVVATFTDVPQGEARGAGRGAGMAHIAFVPTVVPGAPGSDARQITMFARVAQSLANRTGISVEYSRRRVGGEVPPSLVATPATFFDDGIYDDLFASDATRGTLMLKSIVGPEIELAASVMRLEKDYPATFAFDEQALRLEGVLRSDRVSQARLDAVWPLFPSRTGAVSLDLITGYDYTRHRSTSALYRYTSHALRIAFGIAY